MVNPLEALINKRLKEMGVSRTDLAARLGYQIPNKGLRRLDLYLETLDDPAHIAPRIQEILEIPEEEFGAAVSQIRDRQIAKLRETFEPQIRILTSTRHDVSFFSRWAYYKLRAVIPTGPIKNCRSMRNSSGFGIAT